MKNPKVFTWFFFGIMIVLTALACRLPFNLRDRINQSQSDPPVAAEEGLEASMIDVDISVLEEMWDFTLPEIEGETIPLEMGASVFIPEGALPVGTAIDAQVSEVIPLLPEGFNPVGDALILTADAQPQTPVLLRMPIPAGVTDPTNLMIVRIESDGRTTFLMADVDGSDLVAFTPGFSKFCAVELVSGFLREWRPSIFGIPNLLPGQSGTFHLMNVKPGTMVNSQWTVTGDATIQHQDDVSVTITAGQSGGTAIVSYVGIDLDQGIRFSGSRRVIMMSPALLNTLEGHREGFQVAITSNKPKVFEGESLDVMVSFHGHYRLPVLWSYEVNKCLAQVEMISSDHQPVPLSIDCPPGRYEIFVWAEYMKLEDDFINNGMLLRFDVFAKPLLVQLLGPTELDMGQHNISAVYTAQASGGNPDQGEAQNPRYDFSWRVLPGGDWVNYGLSDLSVTDQEFTFDQPGDYRVEVLVKNQDGQEARATLPVLVTGGEPLNAHILSWPDSINPDEPADMKFRIRGGTQILGGKKGVYTATVYWGDGTFDKVDPAAISEEGGASFFTLSHSWDETNNYTVMVFVEDPTGAIAYAEADITVKETISDYQGLVEFVSYPDNPPYGLGIDDDLMRIEESMVHLTVSGNTISASLSFTFYSCRRYSAGRIPNQQPEHYIDCYCESTINFAFNGEGPLTSPVSLVLTQESFVDILVGSECDQVEPSPLVSSATLTGSFDEDGSFYGTLENERFFFNYIGVSAHQVVE